MSGNPLMLPYDTTTLQQVKDNLKMIAVLVTQQINNPSAANVQAIVAAQQNANATVAQVAALSQNIVPSVTNSADGESYDWNAYLDLVLRSIRTVQQLIVMEGGSYIVRSRGSVS
jgi:hypothetical protein